MQKLDQSGDHNLQAMHRFSKLYGWPQFVKDASLADDVICHDQRSNLYADPRAQRQFPIHTKAATYVSYAFFLENGSQLPPQVRKTVQSRLDKAAGYWGIKAACDELVSKHAAANVDSSPDSCYAIVWANGAGQKERRYPLRNGLEVKAAAAWYCQYENDIRQEFAYDDRATIARKILKRAEELGVDVAEQTEQLEQACGRGLCNPVKAANMIRNRATAADRAPEGARVMLRKLAELVENRPSAFMEPGTMRDLARTLDEFDRTYSLVGKYSELLPAPERVLFEATYTKTSALTDSSCATITGSVYSQDQLSKLSASDVRDAFGDEVARQVCRGLQVDSAKMAELVATLPRPDAVIFDDLMSDRGLLPLTKDATVNPVGFTFSQLKQMAAL